jgi:protein gp37
MRKTTIQWCHTTVTAVGGCDGCILWPTAATALRILTEIFSKRDIASAALVEVFWKRTAETSDTLSRALEVLNSLQSSRCDLPRHVWDMVTAELRAAFRCWAGVLTKRFAGRHSGYPPAFQVPTLFPGRLLPVAAMPPPTAVEIKAKPWLPGDRRLVFLNDMGDALSRSIAFESLHQEIVLPVSQGRGETHLWLWLSKRPRRMLEFSKWLGRQGVDWPKNLIPMCSPITAGYAEEARCLMDIPAPACGFSLEPWDHWIDLPSDLFTPQSWFILGGESGAGAEAHPFRLDWARRLRDRVETDGGAFFMKQLGAHCLDGERVVETRDREGGDWNEWPTDIRIRHVPPILRGRI